MFRFFFFSLNIVPLSQNCIKSRWNGRRNKRKRKHSELIFFFLYTLNHNWPLIYIKPETELCHSNGFDYLFSDEIQQQQQQKRDDSQLSAWCLMHFNRIIDSIDSIWCGCSCVTWISSISNWIVWLEFWFFFFCITRNCFASSFHSFIRLSFSFEFFTLIIFANRMCIVRCKRNLFGFFKLFSNDFLTVFIICLRFGRSILVFFFCFSRVFFFLLLLCFFGSCCCCCCLRYVKCELCFFYFFGSFSLHLWRDLCSNRQNKKVDFGMQNQIFNISTFMLDDWFGCVRNKLVKLI